MKMSDSRELLEKAIAILRNVRHRPKMYFCPTTPEAVEQWLYGFQIGLGVAGLNWSPESLTTACEWRGVTLCSTTPLIAELKKQGRSQHDIAMTLIDISEEMWQSRLSDVAEPDAAMDRPRVERLGQEKVGRRRAGH